MQCGSLSIQMDFTVMLPDLTEHIHPAISMLRLLSALILDKRTQNLLKTKGLTSGPRTSKAVRGSQITLPSQKRLPHGFLGTSQPG